MRSIIGLVIASITLCLNLLSASAQTTVSALMMSSGTAGSVVNVQGYYNTGDGGAGPWQYQTGPCSVAWCVSGSAGSWIFVGGAGGTAIDWRQLGATPTPHGSTIYDPHNNNASQILIALEYGCNLGTTTSTFSYVPVWGGGLLYGIQLPITVPTCRGVAFGHGNLLAVASYTGVPYTGIFPPPIAGCSSCAAPTGLVNINNNTYPVSNMIFEDLTLNGGVDIRTGVFIAEADFVIQGQSSGVQIRHSEFVGFANYGLFNDGSGLLVSEDTQISEGGNTLPKRTGIAVWMTGNANYFRKLQTFQSCINLWVDQAATDTELPNSRMFNGVFPVSSAITPPRGMSLTFNADTTAGSNILMGVTNFMPSSGTPTFSWSNINCGMRVATTGNSPIPPGSFIVGFNEPTQTIYISNNAVATSSSSTVYDYGFAPINILNYGVISTISGVFDCGSLSTVVNGSSNSLPMLNATGMTFEWGPSCGNQEGWLVAWTAGSNTEGLTQPFTLIGSVPPVTNPLGPDTNAAGEIVNTVKLMQVQGAGTWSQTALMGAAAVNRVAPANAYAQILLTDPLTSCGSFTANTDGVSATLTGVSFSSGCNWVNLSPGYGVAAMSYVASGSHILSMDPVARTITLDQNTLSAVTGTTVSVHQYDYLVQAQDSGSAYFVSNGGTVQTMTIPTLLPTGWKARFYSNSPSTTATLLPQSGVNINGAPSSATLTNLTPYVINVPGQNNATLK